MEAVKKFKADHEKHLKQAIDELVASGVEEGFVIFETEGEKFVQLTYDKGEGLTLELSRVSMSPEEQGRLRQLEEMEAATETEITYLLQIGVDTRMGAGLADRIFREVFQCKGDYRVQATLDIESTE
jgi:hypothetical protein